MGSRSARGKWVPRRDNSRCIILWRVIGTIACCFLAKLVLGPPHYHDALPTCPTSRVGPRRDNSRCIILWRVIGTIACCFLAKLVLGPPRPPHYHDALPT